MSRVVRSEARKQETREKIEMGRLIGEAVLRDEERALPVDARRRHGEDETERSRLDKIGAEASGHDSE